MNVTLFKSDLFDQIFRLQLRTTGSTVQNLKEEVPKYSEQARHALRLEAGLLEVCFGKPFRTQSSASSFNIGDTKSYHREGKRRNGWNLMFGFVSITSDFVGQTSPFSDVFFLDFFVETALSVLQSDSTTHAVTAIHMIADCRRVVC